MASSNFLEPDVNELITRLASDAQLLTIRSYPAGAKSYRVQKTFLAGVSTKLTKHCRQQPTNLGVSEEALHIFLAWLITRDLNGVAMSQESLAQAWNFGAEYDIPSFQDAVMNRLVPSLRVDDVYPEAVIEAYATDERGTKLQRAFIAQLAVDMRRGDEYTWERPSFTDNDMEDVPGFYLDLTVALSKADQDDALKTSDFLLEVEDDTESITATRREMACNGTNWQRVALNGSLVRMIQAPTRADH